MRHGERPALLASSGKLHRPEARHQALPGVAVTAPVEGSARSAGTPPRQRKPLMELVGERGGATGDAALQGLLAPTAIRALDDGDALLLRSTPNIIWPIAVAVSIASVTERSCTPNFSSMTLAAVTA
jgi:hypothetical protein